MMHGPPVKLRQYQQEAAAAAISGNTVINIPTGGGKTLIAVSVINHFMISSEKAVCFLVPSRSLVGQQAAYLRTNCDEKQGTAPLVEELSGQELEHWSLRQWTETMVRADILVGTPEVFRRALIEKAFISSAQFSIIVFDECHNAVGNSPMAAIMRGSVLKLPERDRPRILGLTASFVSGSTSNVASIMKKRADMEFLFHANILSPHIVAQVDDPVVEEKFKLINYPDDNLTSYRDPVETLVASVLSAQNSSIFNDIGNWTEKGTNLFLTLGAEGLRYWLKEGIVTQQLAKAGELMKNSDTQCQRVGQRILSAATKIRPQLERLDLIPEVALPPRSQQLLALLNLLETLKVKASSTEGEGVGGVIVDPSLPFTFKGIVFVEQVALTYPLSHLINEHFLAADRMNPFHQQDLTARPHPVSLPVSGGSSMLDNVRTSNLDAFRSGKSPILVSTNALEEGIDVPDCSFVIRFDAFNTTKSHIQGSGRARKKNAVVFYFKNSPAEECSKANVLDAIAKNKTLNLTTAEMVTKHKTSITRLVRTTVVYPYYAAPSIQNPRDMQPTGEVNFFNCLQIFYEYVQRVMKQSFSPEVLYDVEEEIVCIEPPTSVHHINAVSFPTPRGIATVVKKDIDDFWGETDVRDVVLPAELLEKKAGFDIAKRRAVYVVVLRLHAEGLLNQSNEPSVVALYECLAACPAFFTESACKYTHKYPSAPKV